jgi:8-oxo-dGTP pyrophosphatase MutT (NUDIX family)
MKDSSDIPENEMDTSTRRMPTRDSITDVGHTKWLALNTIDYTDANGVQRKWDFATRTTKQGMDEPDAVVIVPILQSKKSKTIETILVQQYRPPIGKCSLEFPAGLVDKGESAQDAALRELLEETGFIGTVNQDFQESMILCMSPGICDETVKIVVIDVDMDREENKNPIQVLDEGEDIIVKRVDLMTGLKDMITAGSEMPISFLYSFALGLEIGKRNSK